MKNALILILLAALIGVLQYHHPITFYYESLSDPSTKEVSTIYGPVIMNGKVVNRSSNMYVECK